jgi:hypothetical protein
MVFTEVWLCPQIITTCTSANTYKLINCVCKLICSVLFLHIVGPCNPDPCQNGGTCTVNGADFFCPNKTGQQDITEILWNGEHNQLNPYN